MRISTAPLFDRHFKKLPRLLQEKAKEREKLFIDNPFHPRLGTHKLHGKRGAEWAYSVDYSYRITFLFLSGGEVLYTDVGTHDELY
ncbi:MAG: hypothetical protein G01um101417_422 [Parcubacteria group bacterium Gr01-1014_17]|nr:MAG: hypothetical protein G01um101417_422 [Parcubacteria group bacterium Gr01-1014_17]